MSEPESRPSWMPSDEEIIGWLVSCPDSIEVWDGGRFELAVEWVSRFVERACLKAQIEALDKAVKCGYGDDAEATLEACLEHRRIYSFRLAELEGA